MCEKAEREGRGQETCQDCGRLICFDTKSEDDASAPAFVTTSGDLFCRSCGMKQEAAEMLGEDQAGAGDYYPDPYEADPPRDPYEDPDRERR
jgi:hypothetical protein